MAGKAIASSIRISGCTVCNVGNELTVMMKFGSRVSTLRHDIWLWYSGHLIYAVTFKNYSIQTCTCRVAHPVCVGTGTETKYGLLCSTTCTVHVHVDVLPEPCKKAPICKECPSSLKRCKKSRQHLSSLPPLKTSILVPYHDTLYQP